MKENTKTITYLSPFPLSGELVIHRNRIYRIANKEDFLQFRTFADDTDCYVLRYHKKEDEIFVWNRQTCCGINVIKVYATYPISSHDMANLLQDSRFRGKWDTHRIEGLKLGRLSEQCDIAYYAVKAPVGITNRDFVNQRMWHYAGNGEYVIFSTAVEHTEMPEGRNDCIRGASLITGYLIRPNPMEGYAEGKENGTLFGTHSCTVTYVAQTDPRGWIPTALLNQLSTHFAPSFVVLLRKAALEFPTYFSSIRQEHLQWTWVEDPWEKPQPHRTLRLVERLYDLLKLPLNIQEDSKTKGRGENSALQKKHSVPKIE